MMDRRNFLAASAVGAVSVGAMASEAASSGQQYLELREYHTLLGQKRGDLNTFFKDVAVPAMNRAGIGKVGLFSVMFGSSSPSLYVLIPHETLESVAALRARLMDDDEYCKAGASVLDAPLSDPAYVRVNSKVMRAFSGMPKLEIPKTVEGKDGRIFEMRIYESHSDKAAIKKIEMFNEGGEIEVFRKTGLDPVFFGETIIGPSMPNLTYMLAFESMDERYKRWDVFRNHPDWKELAGKAEYKDTVSNISDIILRPASGSQM